MFLRQHFKMDAASIACCLLAFLLYYNSLDAGFVYDDSRAILNNPDILPTTPIYSLWLNDFWGTALKSSNSHGSYRPICVFSFRLNYWACGFRPWGYHLVNVLLHVLATALVLRVARHVLPSTSSTMAGLLFASHPIHTEAVSGIVGRADMLSCIFYLLSFLMYIHHVRLRDMPFQNDSDLMKKFNNRLSKIDCCDVSFGERKHRFYYALQDAIEVIKLGSCFNVLQDIPGLLSSCSVHQWAYLSLAVVLATAAMLSKETGVTVILVCAVYDVLRSKRAKTTKWRLSFSLGILGLSLCVVLLARMYLMGSHTPVFALSDNPTARSSSLLTRALTFIYLPAANLQLLLYPRWLSYDWSMDAIPRLTSMFDSRNAVSLLLYYTIYKTTVSSIENMFKKRKKYEKCYRRFSKHFQNVNRKSKCPSCRHSLGDVHSASCKASNNNNNSSKCDCLKPSEVVPPQSEIFLVCLALIVVPFLPATNLFVYVGFVIAERVLYLPSVGYCFLVSYGCQLISYRTNPKMIRVSFAVLLCVLSARTLVRNRDWYDEEALYRSGIPVNPPKSYGNLGSVLSTQGRMEEAERAFRMALYYRPNMAEVHYNLGILLQRKDQYEEAIQSYQLAIQCRPSLALAHLNLGQLLASRGRCAEAESVLRRCSQLDGTGLKDRRTHENTRITALLHLGRLHADRGKYSEAVSVYKEAVSSMPQGYQPQILYNLLGEALTRLRRHTEAEQWYRSALHAKPDHIPAHLTYGKLLAKNKTRVIEAERWFQRAQKLAPADPTVYQHFGQFLSELGRHAEAARQYLIGAQLAPDQYDLVLAAATALRQAGRRYEAEVHYRQAAALRPEDSGSHSNLGAILHLNGKYREAAESYREALRLQPHDTTTLNNLQKLRNLLNRIET